MDTNIVVIKGRLTRDVEFKTTATGFELASFCLAVNHYSKDKDKPKVSFFDLVAFGNTAKYLSSYSAKGDEVLVEGEIEQQTWEKEGEKRSKVVIKALRSCILRKKSGSTAEVHEVEPKSMSGLSDNIHEVGDIPF